MRAERFLLPVPHPRIDAVAALFEAPQYDGGDGGAARGSALLLAHGAGAGMDSAFLTSVAHGLVARGFPVLRFQYPYRERAEREGKNKPPDATPLLERAHAAAFAELERRAPAKRLLLAGKSMGGRIGSHLAAKGWAAAGLVLFGYPLHPPRRPERERSEHFAAIVQPALFLQGTRDALCDLELLRRALVRFGGHATVEVVEDADHGFHVRKSSGRTDAEVLEALLARVDRWERETFPS